MLSAVCVCCAQQLALLFTLQHLLYCGCICDLQHTPAQVSYRRDIVSRRKQQEWGFAQRCNPTLNDQACSRAVRSGHGVAPAGSMLECLRIHHALNLPKEMPKVCYELCMLVYDNINNQLSCITSKWQAAGQATLYSQPSTQSGLEVTCARCCCCCRHWHIDSTA